MTEIIKLSSKDVNRILEDYDIGTYLDHKYITWAFSNSVYFLDTTKGRFILKVHQDIGSDKLNFVQNTMEYARNKGLPVAEIIKNNKGRLNYLYKGKVISIQRFVKGKEIGMSNQNSIKLAGEIAGRVDKELYKIPLKRKFYNYKFILAKITKSPVNIKNFDFTNAERQILKDSRKIKIRKLRKSVIHCDLGGHMISSKGKITAIIDWDDAKETYLVSETAKFIADHFLIDKRTLKNKVRVFLNEYQKYVKLNNEEKVALYYLIKRSYLESIEWYVREQKTHNNKDILKWINELLDKYRSFDRIPLKEFIKEID